MSNNTPTPFKSSTELYNAMKDSRYHLDEAYRNQVIARIDATPEHVLQDSGEPIDPVVAAKQAADAARPAAQLPSSLGAPRVLAQAEVAVAMSNPLYRDPILGDAYRAWVEACMDMTSEADLGVTTKVLTGATRYVVDPDEGK